MSVPVITKVAAPHPLPDPPPAVKPAVIARPAPPPVDTVTISAAAQQQSPVSADSAGDGR